MAQKPAYSDKKKAALLAEALMRLPDEWVICRDMRHAWRVLEDFHVSRDTMGRDHIKRDLACMRCFTVRHETYIHIRGGLEKTKQAYTYPDDYQMKGVPRGNKPANLIHQEQYRRFVERIADQARKGA